MAPTSRRYPVLLLCSFVGVQAAADDRCADWAAAGYCDSASHSQYMAATCADACAAQSTEADVDAAIAAGNDTQDAASCASWAEAGYCTHQDYVEYMLVNCAASCRGAGGPSAIGAEGAARLGGGEGYLDWLRGGLRRAIAVVSARSGRGGGGGGGAAPVSLNKECVAWAKLGYCHAGPNQVYMKQTCVAECDEGGRAGTIPEPGSLYQASPPHPHPSPLTPHLHPSPLTPHPHPDPPPP